VVINNLGEKSVRPSLFDSEDVDANGETDATPNQIITERGIFLLIFRNHVNCRRRHGVAPGAGLRFSFSLRMSHIGDVPTWEQWLALVQKAFGSAHVSTY
jgi:hypothetical protein